MGVGQQLRQALPRSVVWPQRGPGRLDYDEIRAVARKAAAKAHRVRRVDYPRLIDFEAFRSIADGVGGLVRRTCTSALVTGLLVDQATIYPTLQGARTSWWAIMACRGGPRNRA